MSIAMKRDFGHAGCARSAVDEVFTRIPKPWRSTLSDYEVAPESYSQAVLDPERRKSMMSEIKALRNIGCWRV